MQQTAEAYFKALLSQGENPNRDLPTVLGISSTLVFIN
jgi:hypothetical protein